MIVEIIWKNRQFLRSDVGEKSLDDQSGNHGSTKNHTSKKKIRYTDLMVNSSKLKQEAGNEARWKISAGIPFESEQCPLL